MSNVNISGRYQGHTKGPVSTPATSQALRSAAALAEARDLAKQHPSISIRTVSFSWWMVLCGDLPDGGPYTDKILDDGRDVLAAVQHMAALLTAVKA